MDTTTESAATAPNSKWTYAMLVHGVPRKERKWHCAHQLITIEKSTIYHQIRVCDEWRCGAQQPAAWRFGLGVNYLSITNLPNSTHLQPTNGRTQLIVTCDSGQPHIFCEVISSGNPQKSKSSLGNDAQVELQRVELLTNFRSGCRLPCCSPAELFAALSCLKDLRRGA